MTGEIASLGGPPRQSSVLPRGDGLKSRGQWTYLRQAGYRPYLRQAGITNNHYLAVGSENTAVKFKITTEFIPLDKLLKVVGLSGSGGEAHAIILEGLVKVNGETELQKRKKIRAGDVVELGGETVTVE